MKKVIENLDRYYRFFINQTNNWGFFLGLADYVKYTIETEEVDNILKFLTQARDNDQKILKGYEQKVINETKQAKEKLFEIIRRHRMLNENLDRAIKEYQGYENETTFSSQPRGEALSEALMDIIHILFKSGYKELVKDFIIEHTKLRDEIGEYTFSKTLTLYEKEKEIFNGKLKIELWASWNNLILAYLTVFKANEELEKMCEDKKNFYTAFNFAGLVNEMKKIREGNIDRIIHFKKESYISHATRIHIYLIKELNKNEKSDALHNIKELENEQLGITSKISEKNFIFDNPEEQTKKIKQENLKTKKLIERTTDNGDFYYKSNLIKFENKDTIYYLIFECLYKNGDLNGFCSYETIDEYLVEHGKEKHYNKRKVIDRIKNGITNLFRFSNLPQNSPDGKAIIQKSRGKGITLYNPTL